MPPLSRPAPLGRDLLAGRRMLVTGGAGFVGSHLVDLLVEGGCDEVIILDDLVQGRVATLDGAMQSGRTRLVVADTRDAALLADLLQGIDTVFHQPATRHPTDVTATAASDLLGRCLRAGVRKVVMTCPAGRMSDGAVQDLLRSVRAGHGLPCLLLRHAEAYGPRMDVEGGEAGLLLRWMDRLVAGLPPLLPGDGRRRIELVHAEDVAQASLLAALSPAAGLPLDIGSGTALSLPDLARLLARIMGRRDVQPEIRPEEAAPAMPCRCTDPAAARDRIGFTPAISLEAGLEALVTWWCAERDRVALQDMAL